MKSIPRLLFNHFVRDSLKETRNFDFSTISTRQSPMALGALRITGLEGLRFRFHVSSPFASSPMIRKPKFRAKQDAKIHQFRGRGLGLLARTSSVVIVESIQGLLVQRGVNGANGPQPVKRVSDSQSSRRRSLVATLQLPSDQFGCVFDSRPGSDPFPFLPLSPTLGVSRRRWTGCMGDSYLEKCVKRHTRSMYTFLRETLP